MLDLRGNGGGLLNEAVLCASIFLEHGNVVSTRSRTQGDQDYPAIGDAIEPAPDGGPGQPQHGLRGRDPDRGAPAERPRRRWSAPAPTARAPSRRSWTSTAGGALDLTVGEYLTADGTSILGEGVKPDVRVADDPGTETDDEALDRALQVVGEQLPPAGN